MNGSGFVMAGDGWVQVTPCGEYPHKGAGVTQVIDAAACAAMVSDFNARKAAQGENFAGLLVDFDHFSLDTDKPSEAAGWITELETRADGLWARVRWSDAGLAAVTGGRYRLLSPVFRHPGGTEDLGGGRVRPVTLDSVALTNEPNIKGGRPIANRKSEAGDRKSEGGGKDGPKGDVMSGPGAKKFMWLVGATRSGTHCPECLRRHGQVKTLLGWLREKPPYCQCKCRLAEVGKDVPRGYEAPEPEILGNRWTDAARAARKTFPGWSDAARLAAVAAKRRLAAEKAASGAESPADKMVRGLDRDLRSASYGVPEGHAGTVMRAGQPAEKTVKVLSSDVPALRDIVGAGPATGNGFVDLVTGAAGVAATFGPAVAAAGGSGNAYGAATRAFGGGNGPARPRAARRGVIGRKLSEAWDNVIRGPVPNIPADVPPEVAAVMAVEREKDVFRARMQVEREALAKAIGERGGSGVAGGLALLPAKQLRDILRSMGGDPDAIPRLGLTVAAPKDDRAAFDALKKRFGGKAAPRPTAPAARQPANETREEFAEYLREALPPSAAGVDAYLGELEIGLQGAKRAAGRAGDAVYAAQAALRKAKDGTPEREAAERALRVARFDYGHSRESAERFDRESRNIRRNLADYLRKVAEGSPLDWSSDDADYEAAWRRARREGGPGFGLENRFKGQINGGDAVMSMVRTLKRDARGQATAANRWSDAARAAAYASRKKSGNYAGWTDSARAAALAVRRDKAAARIGGYYPDGQPVIRDVTEGMGDGYEPGRSYISDGADRAKTQADYERAFRDWWRGVETTSGNIARFNAFVAAVGGAAAAGLGAYRQTAGQDPSAGASRALGRAGKYVSGKEPVYDADGNLAGFAKVGGRPYPRSDNAPVTSGGRRAAQMEFERTGIIRDPATGKVIGRARYGDELAPAPVTAPAGSGKSVPGEALGAEYGNWLETRDSAREADMAARGLDPAGFPISTGDAGVDEALSLYERLGRVDASGEGRRELYEGSLELLRRYGELYESDMTGRADSEGLLPAVRENIEALESGESGGTREAAKDYPEDPALPYEELPPAYPEAAADAARALGVMHGAYGAEGYAGEVPESLRAEYERGLAEGEAGYDYGIEPPSDRAAVLRRAEAFLKGSLGADWEDYAPDHLNDRFNLEKWNDPAGWAGRNAKDPSSAEGVPDTRAQYGAPGLMAAAMTWFKESMAAGKRGEANAALAYMADLMLSVSADRRAAFDESRGEGADEDAPEVDARMDEYDEDGVETGGQEPFYEDRYADPGARQPFEDFDIEFPFARRVTWRNRRGLLWRLANRHGAACSGASGPECGCSCGGSLHGGGDPIDASRDAFKAKHGRPPSGETEWAEAAGLAGVDPRGLDASGVRIKPPLFGAGAPAGNAGSRALREAGLELFRKQYGRAPVTGADYDKVDGLGGVPKEDWWDTALHDDAADENAGIGRARAKAVVAGDDAKKKEDTPVGPRPPAHWGAAAKRRFRRRQEAAAKEAAKEARGAALAEKRRELREARQKLYTAGWLEDGMPSVSGSGKKNAGVSLPQSWDGRTVEGGSGFSVSGGPAVYYGGDGVWFDGNGKRIDVERVAPRRASDGSVFVNGVWVNPKTGRTVSSGFVKKG